MACTISHTAATMGLSSFPKVVTLSSKRTLVYLAIFCTTEWHAIVLQLDNGLCCFLCHVMDGILVSKPVTALDRIVHMPNPVILLHVAQCRIDASLCGHGVGPRGKQFGDAGRLEPVLRQSKGRPQSGTARSHDNGIVRVIDNLVVPRSLLLLCLSARRRRM